MKYYYFQSKLTQIYFWNLHQPHLDMKNKTKVLKKLHQEPIKSQSPDLSSKNRIKSTALPINGLYQYVKKRINTQEKGSTSLNYSQMVKVDDVQFEKKRMKTIENDSSQTGVKNMNTRQLSLRLNSQLLQERQLLKAQKNRRVQDAFNIQRKEDKIRQLEQQNERLFKENKEMKKNQKVYSKERQAIQVIKQYYQNNISSLLKEKEVLWDSKLRQFQTKLISFKLSSSLSQSKQKQVLTPTKTNDCWSNHDTPKSVQNQQEKQKLINKNMKLQDQIAYLKNQLNNLRAKYGKLEGDLLKFSIDKNQSFNNLKLSSLTADQQIKSKKIVTLERALKERDIYILLLKEKLERSNQMIENQMANYKKILQQEKQKNVSLQQSRLEISKKYEHISQNLTTSNDYLKERQNKVQELEDAKRKHEECIKQKDQFYTNILSYFSFILNEFQRQLLQINMERKSDEKQNLQKQFSHLKEEFEKFFSLLKQKLTSQKQELLLLSRANEQILKQKNEVNEEKSTIEKLLGSKRMKIQVRNGHKKSKSTLKMKGSLIETMEKIDTLEQKITKILKQ